jgi:hypothetical protein
MFKLSAFLFIYIQDGNHPYEESGCWPDNLIEGAEKFVEVVDDIVHR